MAVNYALNTSEFRPFSFEEKLRPLQIYTQAYNEALDNYSTIEAEAKKTKFMLNQEKDLEAYKQYNDYINSIQNQVNDIISNGLNPKVRSNINKIRSNYNESILPIQTAFSKRAEDNKKEEELLARDPSLIYEYRSRDRSLDEYIKDPLKSSRTISKDVTFNKVAQIMSNLKTALNENPNNWKGIINDALGPQYFEKLVKKGYTPEQVAQSINSPNNSGILNDIVDNVIKSTGAQEWLNKEELSDFKNYINQAQYFSVGTGDYQRLQNDRSLDIAMANISQNNLSNDDITFALINEPRYNIKEGDEIKNKLNIIKNVSEDNPEYKEIAKEFNGSTKDEIVQKLNERLAINIPKLVYNSQDNKKSYDSMIIRMNSSIDNNGKIPIKLIDDGSVEKKQLKRDSDEYKKLLEGFNKGTVTIRIEPNLANKKILVATDISTDNNQDYALDASMFDYSGKDYEKGYISSMLENVDNEYKKVLSGDINAKKELIYYQKQIIDHIHSMGIVPAQTKPTTNAKVIEPNRISEYKAVEESKMRLKNNKY